MTPKLWMLVCGLLLTSLVPDGEAGPAAYGACQAGCAAMVVACYAAGGFTFGTVTAGAGAPAVVVACNVAFGKCSATCAALLLAPTP